MIREGGPPAVDVSWDSMVRGRVGGSEATSSSTHSSLEAKTSEALPDHEGVALTAAVRTGGPRAGMAGGGPCVGGDWRHSRRVDLVQSLRLLITESSVSRVNEPYCGGLRSLDRLYLERPRTGTGRRRRGTILTSATSASVSVGTAVAPVSRSPVSTGPGR